MAAHAMIQENFWENGPKPGTIYDLSSSNCDREAQYGGRSRTLNPSVTGTSVVGVKFNGGVVLAADKLGSYGSLARYSYRYLREVMLSKALDGSGGLILRNINRIIKVNDSTILGGGGDYADFQFLEKVIEQHVIEEESLNDGFSYTPKSLFSWLTRVLYVRRSQFDPLWTTLVVAGMENDEPFLGYIDKLGMSYQAPTVATGFGLHLAQPILREVVSSSPSLSREQAIQAVTRCMTVLFYRDGRSLNKYDVVTVTKDGVEMSGPLKSHTNWDIAHLVKENV